MGLFILGFGSVGVIVWLIFKCATRSAIKEMEAAGLMSRRKCDSAVYDEIQGWACVGGWLHEGRIRIRVYSDGFSISFGNQADEYFCPYHHIEITGKGWGRGVLCAGEFEWDFEEDAKIVIKKYKMKALLEKGT
jgi:hypothetical protein